MLNGNLAVTLQVLAVVLVAEVVVTCSGETAPTPAITPLEVSMLQCCSAAVLVTGVQGARLCVDSHQAVVLAQLTLATALRVYQPTLYLELSLKVNKVCSLPS